MWSNRNYQSLKKKCTIKHKKAWSKYKLILLSEKSWFGKSTLYDSQQYDTMGKEKSIASVKILVFTSRLGTGRMI